MNLLPEFQKESSFATSSIVTGGIILELFVLNAFVVQQKITPALVWFSINNFFFIYKNK